MSETPDFGALHFLVVDDDSDSRSAVVEYLRSMGAKRITVAKNGAEAALVLDKDPTIGFVISDWQMPQMTGLSLLQRMRSSPTQRQLPFLIMTSPVSEEAERIILAAESYVDAYLIKPFRGQAMRDKIEALLAKPFHGAQPPVVVVDDSADARETIVEYLKQLGFRDLHVFEHAIPAFQHIRAHAAEVGLIVSDWEMPDVSGLELLKRCKAEPETRSIPFLMVTSQSSIERMKVMQAAQAQVDQYLLKPFALDDIRAKVQIAFDRARFRGEIDELIADARAASAAGSYRQTQNLLERVLKLDPTHDVGLRTMAEVLLKTQSIDASLPYLKRAVEAHPESAASALRLAQCYEQLGKLDLAFQVLRQAVKQIAFSAELHFALGRVLERRGDAEGARMEYQKTLELELDHREAKLLLSRDLSSVTKKR